MKTKLKIAAALFFSLLLNQVNAQMKLTSIPDVVAKPAFEGTDAGLNMKVWIMSIIRDMNSSEAPGNTSDDDADRSTHNVLIEVENENGKVMPDEIVKLLMVTPSGKKEAVELDPKNNEYGGSLALLEQGEYQFTITLNENGKPVQKTFNYKIYR